MRSSSGSASLRRAATPPWTPLLGSGPEPGHELLPERRHGSLKVFGAAPVVEDVVGCGQLALRGGLGGYHGGCLGWGDAAPGDGPLDLLRLVGGDHDEGLQADPVAARRLDEQRGVDHEHRVQRVGGSEPGVDAAVGAEDSRAEALHHSADRGPARREDLVGDAVGVDDDRTPVLEQARHRRLPRTDSPGEPDEDHARGTTSARGPASSPGGWTPATLPTARPPKPATHLRMRVPPRSAQPPPAPPPPRPPRPPGRWR